MIARLLKRMLEAERARRAARRTMRLDRVRQGLCPECGERRRDPRLHCCLDCAARIVPFI